MDFTGTRVKVKENLPLISGKQIVGILFFDMLKYISMMVLNLVRLKDWYHYVFICSIYFFISHHGSFTVVYPISLLFLLSAIYMLNDFFDLEVDLIKPNQDSALLSFRRNNKILIKYIFITLLLLSLIGFLFISFRIFVLAASIVVIMLLYSHRNFFLKSIPVIDLISILLTYSLLVLTSFNDLSGETVILSSFIGLMAFDAHILQGIRDLEVDSRSKIRTTVSFMGKEKSFRFFKSMIVLTSLYLGFFLFKIFNMYYAIAALLLLPVLFERSRNPEVLWKHFKFLSGVIFCLTVLGLAK